LQPANKAPEALAYFSPSLKDDTAELGIFPSGFWNANTAQYAECDFEYLVKPLRDRGWPAALLSASEVDARLAAMHKQWLTHPDYIVAIILSTAISDVIRQAFYAQTLVNQATVACALERYRIETGSYPDSLALVTLTDGKPLPLDIMTGQPMGYRKTANGKYALWCVSLNGKDHGGTRVLNRRRPESAKIWKDTYAGDWVWDFPEK